MLLLGTDEAGYGPNLGPLLIAASAWSIPDDLDVAVLDQYVAKSIAREPAKGRSPDARWLIADSKQLYNPARGLAQLESNMHLAFALRGAAIDSWQQLWRSDFVDPGARFHEARWHCNFDVFLPICAPRLVPEHSHQLQEQLSQCGVRLESLRVRAFYPEEFNRLVEQHGTKSHLLSQATIELLAQTLRALPRCNALAVCDKHGARNRYGELLQPHFESWIEVVRESAELSVYRWRDSDRSVELRFQPRSECYLPTALASMTAKYLRELAMLAFNQYWCAQLPGLKPTAGYPLDARRFANAIRDRQQELGISDHELWRSK